MTKTQFLDGIEPSVVKKMLATTLEFLSDCFGKTRRNLTKKEEKMFKLIDDLEEEVLVIDTLKHKYEMFDEQSTISYLIELLEFAKMYKDIPSKLVNYAKFRYESRMKRVLGLYKQNAPLIIIANELNISKNIAFAYFHLQNYFRLDRNQRFTKD